MSYADSVRYRGVEEGVIKGRQLGIQEGVVKGILQTAKNLLRQGVEMDTISLATGLEHEQLLELRQPGAQLTNISLTYGPYSATFPSMS
ncbi:MAG: hypothetical protein AAF706_00905 [Bacteroidota bacterium]